MVVAKEREIIEVCGHAGKILLESGAETARVESTVEYIDRAAGIKISCHAEMTAIFVDSNDNPTTHLVKVRTGDFNLQKVDEINTLSRAFTEHKITFDELKSGSSPKCWCKLNSANLSFHKLKHTGFF
ncbi:threonine/serine exporter family protein [Pediococcus siamensis]|uniref:threonine/serine exporter family protein n=1 Tax=Pediococcus siamensis TaxID=381829 RepID=UPI0039A1A224